MKTLADFKATLNLDQPPKELSPLLKSLWYDRNGDWNVAHAQIDHLDDPESAWVHAYLHRKEGDFGNADYWYHKARQTRPSISLEEEWEQLVINIFAQ